jgi:hypothetical protein
MKKFLLYSALFFGVLLLINCGFYFLVDKIYWKGYFQHIDDTHKSYLMADSHGLPLKGFTEEYGVFNFATESDSYVDIYRKIKFAINNNAVSNIVISVDDHTLSTYRESMNNLDRSIGYSDIDDYPDVYAMIKEKYIRHYVVLLNPKSRSMIRRYFETSVLNWLGQKHEHASFTWGNLSDEDRQSRADGRASQQFPENKRSEQLTNHLLDIIDLCKETRVNLIGVKFPLSRAYASAIGDQGYKADSIFHSKGLTVLDFSTIYFDHNEYFENQDHLNLKGGELFSKELAEALQGEFQ